MPALAPPQWLPAATGHPPLREAAVDLVPPRAYVNVGFLDGRNGHLVDSQICDASVAMSARTGEGIPAMIQELENQIAAFAVV